LITWPGEIQLEGIVTIRNSVYWDFIETHSMYAFLTDRILIFIRPKNTKLGAIINIGISIPQIDIPEETTKPCHNTRHL
jgi:hypothetical protein